MSLTDKLRNGDLPDGTYFCKTALGAIDVFECVDGNLFTFADENQVYFVDEVIAPCDYDELQRLRQLLKEGIRILSFEHETYEAENFIKEANEVLK